MFTTALFSSASSDEMKPLKGPFGDSRLSSTLRAFLAAKLAEIEAATGQRRGSGSKGGEDEAELVTKKEVKKVYGSVKGRYNPNKSKTAQQNEQDASTTSLRKKRKGSRKQSRKKQEETKEEAEESGPVKSPVPSQRLELFLSSTSRKEEQKKKEEKLQKQDKTNKKLQSFIAGVQEKKGQPPVNQEANSGGATTKVSNLLAGKAVQESKAPAKLATPLVEKKPSTDKRVEHRQATWIKPKEPEEQTTMLQPPIVTTEIQPLLKAQAEKPRLQRLSRERSKLTRRSKLRIQATNRKEARLSSARDTAEPRGVPESDFRGLAVQFANVFESNFSNFEYIYQAGFLMWRVCETDSGFEAIPVSKNGVGIFFQGDCFIAVNTKAKRSGEHTYDVHLWCGLNTTAACEEAALRYVVEFYGVLQGAAVLHREREFNESQLFQSYFSHCGMTHMDGDWASAFTNSNSYNRDLYKRMFAFKQNPKCLHLYEVECAVDNFDDTQSYLLDFGYTLYYCFGDDTTPRIQYAAKVAITRIAEEHGVGSNVSMLPAQEFRDLVTTNNTVYGVRDDTEELLRDSARSRDVENCKLFKVGGTTKSYSFEHVRPSGEKFDLFELNEEEIYVIETNVDVVTWVGRKADKKRIESPFEISEAFCKESGMAENTVSVLIQQDLRDSMLRTMIERIV